MPSCEMSTWLYAEHYAEISLEKKRSKCLSVTSNDPRLLGKEIIMSNNLGKAPSI